MNAGGGRASLRQDVWLGFEPRLRARRLAPYEEPSVRLLLQLDFGESLDDPPLADHLALLAGNVEVLAWEPRTEGGRPSLASLADARLLAQEGGRRFGTRAVFLGGRGLSAWVALATAAAVDTVSGAVAFAPSLARAGAARPQPSPLRTALAGALAGTRLARPALVLEGRERPAAESRVVDEWLAQAPDAVRLVVPGDDGGLDRPPWPAVVASWMNAPGPRP